MISRPNGEPLIKRQISDSELARLLKWRSGPPRPGAIGRSGRGRRRRMAVALPMR
jgi:hypothetical protein